MRNFLIPAAAIAAALTVLVLGAFAIQYHLDDHPIVLPRPRGPHAVGRVLMDWNDARRNRELMVFIWYPAAAGASGPRAEYVPGRWGDLLAAGMLPIPARRMREIGVSAIEDAPLAPGPLPILILLPGIGRIPAHYTTIAEDLASYGFVVVGVTPTGSARPAVIFPDGHAVAGQNRNLNDHEAAQQLVQTWADDASFALERVWLDPHFEGHLREQSACIFGHSFGGNVAVHALAYSPLFTRAANLDGSLYGDEPGKPGKPLLILCADSIDDEWKPLCASGAASCTAFPNARHMDFSDAAVLPSRFPIPRRMLLLSNAGRPAFLYQVSDRLRAFFEGARLQ